MSEYHNTAIVFGDPKEALLYYEFIIPVFCPIRHDYKTDKKAGYVVLIPDTVATALPPYYQDEEFHRRFCELNYLINGIELPDAITHEQKSNLHLSQQLYLSFFLKQFELMSAPIDCPPHLADANEASDCATLNLTQLSLVDVSKTSLRQITDFRKDKQAFDKMRRFRAFAYTNYADKPKSFIEDDILKKWDEYQDAVKKWGFETHDKTMTFLYKNIPLMSGTVGAIAKAFTGSTETALLASLTGVIAQLGLLKLELQKQQHALGKIAQEHPISYISDVKENLEAC